MAAVEGLCTARERAPTSKRSWPKPVAGMRRGPRPIRGALLLLALVLRAKGETAADGKRGITCVGREPGYYADPGSQCHRSAHFAPISLISKRVESNNFDGV